MLSLSKKGNFLSTQNLLFGNEFQNLGTKHGPKINLLIIFVFINFLYCIGMKFGIGKKYKSDFKFILILDEEINEQLFHMNGKTSFIPFKRFPGPCLLLMPDKLISINVSLNILL